MINVKFNGYVTNTPSGGCVPCGQKRRSKRQYSTTITLNLPSGIMKTFVSGRVEEVTQQDFEYLMLYGSVTVGGEVKPVFEVIE